MPSEKQIEAFARYRRKQIAELRPYIEGEDVSSVSISTEDAKAGSPKHGDMIARNPKNHADQWLVARAYFLDNFEALAAEQAEPLDNDVEVHRWQRATAVQSRKLQMVLDIPGVKERLQEITGSPDEYMLAGIEQAEPAPAARSGAVKEIVEEVCEGWCKESGGRGSFSDCLGCRIHRDLAALEPAEPAPDVRYGAVKVKELMCDFEDFINQPPQYEDQRMVRDYRHELYRKWEPLCRLILAALEPAEPAEDAEREFNEVLEGAQKFNDALPERMRKNARDWLRPDDEPATDAVPVAWSYEMANYIDNDGSYTGWVGPRLSFQKPNAPEGAVRNVIPLFTHPSESQLRELIATLLPHLNLTSPGALDLMKEAMRVLGGPDAVR